MTETDLIRPVRFIYEETMTTLQPAHEPALTFDFRPTLQPTASKGCGR